MRIPWKRGHGFLKKELFPLVFTWFQIVLSLKLFKQLR